MNVDAAPLLVADSIVKRFSGITALSDVSLQVGAGETVGLIGPNGAGKTTLFNCLLGILRPDGGRVVLDGTDLTNWPIHRRSRAGFGRTFQRIELFAGMTVVEHLLVAARARRGNAHLWKDVVGLDRPTADDREDAARTLELLGLTDVAERPIEALSLGRGRLVEVGRALMSEPKLLLLDEPSSGLDRSETAELTETLEVVNRERGTAILLVEHDVEMVQRFASRLYVLDFGTLIAEGPTRTVMSDPSVRRAYLGESNVSDSGVGEAV